MACVYHPEIIRVCNKKNTEPHLPNLRLPLVTTMHGKQFQPVLVAGNKSSLTSVYLQIL